MTSYGISISDGSSDVVSSDVLGRDGRFAACRYDPQARLLVDSDDLLQRCPAREIGGQAFALDAVAQGEFEVLRGSRLSQVAVDQRHLLARPRDPPAERQTHGGLTLTLTHRSHPEDRRRLTESIEGKRGVERAHRKR